MLLGGASEYLCRPMKEISFREREKPFGIIYKAENIINKKVYIGQTTRNLNERKFSHISSSKKGSNCYFHLAIKKYGTENFIWSIIDECYSLEECNIKEEHYILLYRSYEKQNGYNIKMGGFNFKLAEETKIKISLANKGKKHTEEAKRKMSESRTGEKHFRFGKHLSEEHRQKLREKKLGIKHSEETKKKFSENRKGVNNSMFGKKRTMSQEQKDKYKIIFSDERNPMFGKKHSNESKKKMSEKAIGRKGYFAKKVIDLDTGKIFESAKEAAEFLNMNYGTLRCYLNGRRINKTNLKYHEH